MAAGTVLWQSPEADPSVTHPVHLQGRQGWGLLFTELQSLIAQA